MCGRVPATVCVCACARTRVRELVENGSLFLPYGTWSSNSGKQTWWQTLLATEKLTDSEFLN